MGKPKKGVKKFNQRRNSGQKLFHKKPVWKRRGPAEDAGAQGEQEEDALNTKTVAEMDVDEFLEGAFLDAGGDSDGGSEEDGSDEDDDSDGSLGGSESEDDEGAAANGIDDDASDEDLEESSDEDDAEGDEDTGGVGAQNRRLKSEVSAHKAQLEKLREADPEFYDYLASTDKELLAFGEEDDSEEDGDESDEEESEDEGAGQEHEEGDIETAPGAAAAIESAADRTLTLAQVDIWCRAAKDGSSLGALRSLLRAYRVACHYGDSEDNVDEGMRIGSSAVYNRLMLFVLREADGILRAALGVGAVVEAASLLKLPRWRKVEPLIKSYLGNTLHLLGQMTDSGMLAFIIRRIRASVVFLAPFAKIQRRFLKSALQVFGSADDGPRVQAILLIRSMALVLPPPSMDACLKGVYRAFSSNAKFVNAASAPHINFMAAAVVEMYGLDAAAAYQHAFGFIRQLAMLVRQALTSKSKDAYREVYCWQTINCLELWANVLAAHADAPDLRPLVYPVAQLLLGAARLVPTPSYFPLRLRCARALNRLAATTGVFVPVAPILLEILQWRDLARSPKPAPGDKPPEILLQLRVGKSAMRSAAFQEEIVEQVIELLAGHLAQWGCHVAFPELAHLPLAQLRRFAKSTSVERFRRSARQLADAIERNIAFVGRARDQVDFSPKDLAHVGSFLAKEASSKASPVVQHSATLQERARQRLAMRSAKEVEIGAVQLPGTGRVAMGEDDEDEEVDEPEGDFLPSKKKDNKRGRANIAEDDDDEEEEEGPVQRRKKATLAGKKEKMAAAMPDDDDDVEFDSGAEDEVEAYELSDDDEGEEESDGDGAAMPAAAPSRGAKKKAHTGPGASAKGPKGGKGKGKGKNVPEGEGQEK